MANFDHPNSEFSILNRIDDAVSAVTDSVAISCTHFFATGRSRIFGKGFSFFKDVQHIRRGNLSQVFSNGFLEKYFI